MVDINFNDISLIETLGKGTFSNVYKCRYKNNIYAAKEYKIKYNKWGKNEFKILKQLESNNIYDQYPIIKVIGNINHNLKYYIIMELVEYNLLEYYNNNNITIFDFKYISNQIINGLSYIHNYLVHCDLKPENIVIDKNKNIKIIDFGSSFYTNELKIFNNKTPYIQSRYYRAPEILYRINFNSKVDIWSLGCILYEILAKRPLFSHRSEIDMLHGIADKIGIPYMYESYRNSKKFNNNFILIKGNYQSINYYYKEYKYKYRLDKYMYEKLNKINKNENEILEIIHFLDPMLKYNPEERISADLLKNNKYLFKK
jgi:dual specificity protein kinase YAK1